MKRTGFKPKATWKRLERHKPINKAGPKTKEWDAARVDLKTKFLALGVTTCELHYGGCWRDNALGFAHPEKRRKLGPKDLKHVILACNPCHDILEVKPPEEMKRIVDTICQQRESMLTSRQLFAP